MSIWKIFGTEEEGPPEGVAKTPGAPDVTRGSKPPPRGSKPPPAGSTPAPPIAGPALPGVLIDAAGAPRLPEKTVRYGIDDAIKLMRSLPVEENVDLVVRVMRTTLESLKVKVGDIVEDAGRRQEILRKKIGDYQAQIAQFEREVDARKHEIGRLEDELGEITRVKERLQAAETVSMTPPAPHARSAPPLPTRAKKPSIPPPQEVVEPIEEVSLSPLPATSEPDVDKPSS